MIRVGTPVITEVDRSRGILALNVELEGTSASIEVARHRLIKMATQKSYHTFGAFVIAMASQLTKHDRNMLLKELAREALS